MVCLGSRWRVTRDRPWNLVLRGAQSGNGSNLAGHSARFAAMLARVDLVDLSLNFGRIDVREIGAKFRKRQQRLHDPELSDF